MKFEHKPQIVVQVGAPKRRRPFWGALTTPRHHAPLAIPIWAPGRPTPPLSMRREISAPLTAGAGDMVTMIIARELGLEDAAPAEEIKKYPLAKVESRLICVMQRRQRPVFPSAYHQRYLPRLRGETG